MTKSKQEQISTLVDDALSGAELRETVDVLCQDEALRETWGRYHLIGDAIRGEAVGRAYPDIAARVRESLALEPAIVSIPKRETASRQQPGSSWVRPLTGFALAASVALLAVLAAPRLMSPAPDLLSPVSPPLAQQPAAPMTPMATMHSGGVAIPVATNPSFASYAAPVEARWKNLAKPALETKLNNYLIDHNEYSGHGEIKGITTPYATYIRYDANR